MSKEDKEILLKNIRGRFKAFLQGKQNVNWAVWPARSQTVTSDNLRQMLAELESEYGEAERLPELVAKLRELGREV